MHTLKKHCLSSSNIYHFLAWLRSRNKSNNVARLFRFIWSTSSSLYE